MLGLLSRLSWWQMGEKAKTLGRWIEAHGWDPSMSLRQYQMAFVVDQLLREYDVPRQGGWPDDADQRLAFIHHCTVAVTNVLTDADRETGRLTGKELAGSILNRRAYEQFFEFDDTSLIFPRILLLHEAAHVEEQRQQITLDEVLRKHVGFDIEEWIAYGFGLYAILMYTDLMPVFPRDFYRPSSDFPLLMPESMGRFLDLMSLDYEQFRQESLSDRHGRRPGYELFNLNPLLGHPIVRTPAGSYVVPVAGYFLRRITTGLVFTLFQAAESDRSVRGRIWSIIGAAVEGYVRRLLDDLPGNAVIIKPDDDDSGDSRCDFIRYDGDVAVLVECKRKSLDQSARTTGAVTEIREAVKGKNGVVGALKQLLRTAQAVRAGEYADIPPDARLVLVPVTLDTFYQANTSYIREIIEDEFGPMRDELRGFTWQICPVPDLERLIKLVSASGVPLGELLLRKASNPSDGALDVAQWVLSAPQLKLGSTGGGKWEIPSHRQFYQGRLAGIFDRFRRSAA
jgi:hypothetical protein